MYGHQPINKHFLILPDKIEMVFKIFLKPQSLSFEKETN